MTPKRNQMADIIIIASALFKLEKINLKDMDKAIRIMQSNQSPLIKTDADYGYFMSNYIASLLKNYCRIKKPSILRDKNSEGHFQYWVSDEYLKVFKARNPNYLTDLKTWII